MQIDGYIQYMFLDSTGKTLCVLFSDISTFYMHACVCECLHVEVRGPCRGPLCCFPFTLFCEKGLSPELQLSHSSALGSQTHTATHKAYVYMFSRGTDSDIYTHASTHLVETQTQGPHAHAACTASRLSSCLLVCHTEGKPDRYCRNPIIKIKT